ncbi:unnamed protein product [Orchesella dallaii]|uniref:Uncharacterized protein n=1 Tax=Orchesella dallaii TaxID=48710 RepID=A0ABP1PIW7_9HEXA
MIPSFSSSLLSLVLIVSVFGSANGLRCWECNGYDTVEHQCSPTNDGKSKECPGENPVCELKQEKNLKNSGTVYYTRKCASGSELVAKVGSCDKPENVNDVLVSHCYCNDKDNCNKVSISGIGEERTSSVGGKGGNGAAFHSLHYGLMVLIFSVTFMAYYSVI